LGTSQEDLFAVMTKSRLDLLTMRRVSEKLVEKIKIQVLYSVTFSQKWCCFLNSVEKFRIAGQDTDTNIIQRMHFP
jgi:hypothetical protein